jgi:ABC-type uncharacterized transport system fused permease/ATPase subunit
MNDLEATSALDLESEAAMYELLNNMNVTVMSVGHRPSLLKYHNTKLVLTSPGNDASLVKINQENNSFIDIETSLI